MSNIQTGTDFQVFFSDNLTEFKSRETAGTLITGALYLVGNIVYLAITNDEARPFGSVHIGSDPTDPAEGAFYYNPTYRRLSVAIYNTVTGDVELVDLGDLFKGFHVENNKLYLTRANGEKIQLTLPIAQSINESAPSADLLPSEAALVSYINTRMGSVINGLHPKGIYEPGETTITSAKEGEFYRVEEASGTFAGRAVVPGDWIVFLRDSTAPFVYEEDFVIFKGVENAAVDTPIENERALPLSAHGAWLLNQLIDGKIDKMAGSNAGNAGQLVMSTADGSVARTGLTVREGVVRGTAEASETELPTEAAVRAALDLVAVSATLKWQVIP